RETVSRIQAKAWAWMVALQQPLHPVYDPRMDQFLRRGLQPHLHLRTIALRIWGESRRSQPPEKSGYHRLQRSSFVVHIIPRSHMVLSDWQDSADQDGKNNKQTQASPASQYCPSADNFLCSNRDPRFEVTSRCPKSLVFTQSSGESSPWEDSSPPSSFQS